MATFEGQVAGWVRLQENTSAHSMDLSETITALVRDYSTTLYRVAYSVTRNAAEAEDAVQETFLRVLRHQEKLAEIRDARVWLVRITWNLVLDRKRRAKTRPESEDVDTMTRTLAADIPSASESLISHEMQRRILEQVDRLPAKERQALLLSAVEELSTAQIADVVGTTESSVRSRIFRARRVLAQLLEKERIGR